MHQAGAIESAEHVGLLEVLSQARDGLLLDIWDRVRVSDRDEDSRLAVRVHAGDWTMYRRTRFQETLCKTEMVCNSLFLNWSEPPPLAANYPIQNIHLVIETTKTTRSRFLEVKMR